jgi:spore coat-associated protein N
MSLKKKLGLGVASAALGLSLVGGGTYAYFSDTAVANNTFAAGTLDLAVNPTTIFDVSNLKPGDTMLRAFELQNNGTLDIKNVVLDSSYRVTDAKGNNAGADFGEHIKVNFMVNVDKLNVFNPNAAVVVWETTLADLSEMSPEVVKNQIDRLFGDKWGTKGLIANSKDFLGVELEFNDNGKDQNIFQGDSLQLTWTFTGNQTAGEAK